MSNTTETTPSTAELAEKLSTFIGEYCEPGGTVIYRRLGRVSLLQPQEIRFERWADTDVGERTDICSISIDQQVGYSDLEAHRIYNTRGAREVLTESHVVIADRNFANKHSQEKTVAAALLSRTLEDIRSQLSSFEKVVS